MPLKKEKGDIWSFASEGWIVVPTNIGWKKSGANVMGRGLASQAAQRNPALASWYGQQCSQRGIFTPVLPYLPGAPSWDELLLFPTKELNEASPHLSWQNGSSLRLITRSCEQLLLWAIWHEDQLKTDGKQIYVPMVGTGNGGLPRSDVLPILEEILSFHPAFVLVDNEE